MARSDSFPPHLKRILTALDGTERPVVQLWAWPGSGTDAILRELAREEPVPAGRVSARGSRGRWLVWEGEGGGPSWSLVETARSSPQRRLVFAGRRRWSTAEEGLVEHLPPDFFLLDESETASLVESFWVGPGGGAVAGRLHRATDGWLRPLALALAAGAAKGRPEATPEGLLQVPAVATFLRDEVFSPLPEAFRELLLEIAAEDDVDPGLWREIWGGDEARLRALSYLIEQHGLMLPRPGGGYALPRLLTRFLRSERDRLWTSGRSFAQCQRVALVHYSLGRPARALAALVEGGDPARVSALVDLEWPSLLAAAAPRNLLAAERLARPGPGSPGRFLARAAEIASGARLPSPADLDELRREFSTDADTKGGGGGALAAAAELVAASAEPVAAEGAVRRIEAEKRLAGGRALPASTAAWLAVLSEAPDAGVPPASPEASLAEHLRVLAARRVSASAKDGRKGVTAEAVRTDVHREREGASSPGTAPVRAPGAGAESSLVFETFLFGIPKVLRRSGGEEVEVSWPLRRTFDIFAYLIASPDLRVSREELVDTVWMNEPDGVVDRNFHPTLSHLRRTLIRGVEDAPPPLVFRSGVYRLNTDIAWEADFRRFENLARRAAARLEEGDTAAAVQLGRAAWGVYRGPFMEGHYAAWALERRESLNRLYLDTLRLLGDASFHLGEIVEATDAYRALLMADPLQERVHVALMRIYGRQGRRDLVRRQFDRLRGVLDEELGVEPMEESLAEYHRLMG